MNNRISKINELIKTEVATILLRELNLKKGFVTVSSVDTTADLRLATVWCLVIGLSEESVAEELRKIEKEVQKLINSKLALRHVPKLFFRIDHSGSYANEISEIIKKVNEADKH